MDNEIEMVSAREYARRNGYSDNTVSRWLREGKLNGVKCNQQWMVDPTQKAPYKKNEHRQMADKSRILCRTCTRVRNVSQFTETGAIRLQCRDCHKHATTHKKYPCRASVISYAIDLAIYQELSKADESIKADRRRRVEAHAERIQSLGLAGNGRYWKD